MGGMPSLCCVSTPRGVERDTGLAGLGQEVITPREGEQEAGADPGLVKAQVLGRR